MVRVGIVGYGLSGAQFHAPLISAAGLHVSGVVTAHPERAARARADFPGADIVPTLAALLERGSTDLVVVASPSGVHADNARQAIEAGLPVVVDKPLAPDSSRALEVVEQARAGGIPLTVFQNRRWDVDFKAVQDLLSRGVLGQVRRTESRYERWRSTRREGWRGEVSAADGGGLLLDLGTHLIDQVVQLYGPVHSVYAELRSWLTVAEDDAFLALVHESGQASHVLTSSVAGAPGPRWRVTGSRGTYLRGSMPGEPGAFADADGGPRQCGWVVRGSEREPVALPVSDPADFYRQVAAALASAQPQQAMPVDPLDAVHVLAVIDAARISAEDARVVEVMTPGRVPR